MFRSLAKSNFVKGINAARKRAAGQQKLASGTADWYMSLPERSLPPLQYMQIIGSDGPDHFKSVGAGVFSELVDRFSLGSSSNVVDIGCGCGRVAIPFSRLITGGSYWGIDVWKNGIEWCRSNISSANPNFHFVAVPTANDYYFEEFDPSRRNQYSLEAIGDGSVDLCFAISLFTHLTMPDSLSYLREVRRVLAPSGSAFITCFIIDEYFAAFSRRTGHHSALEELEEGVFHAYSGQDFFAGFSRPTWEGMLERCGLKVVSAETGKWAEKPGARPYQDTFIVVRDDWSR